MSTHDLLYLSNELGKRDKIAASFTEHLIIFAVSLINTIILGRMSDYVYRLTMKLFLNCVGLRKNVEILS